MVLVKIKIIDEEDNNNFIFTEVDPMMLISKNEFWYLYFTNTEKVDNSYPFIAEYIDGIPTLNYIKILMDIIDKDVKNPNIYQLYSIAGYYITYILLTLYGGYKELKTFIYVIENTTNEIYFNDIEDISKIAEIDESRDNKNMSTKNIVYYDIKMKMNRLKYEQSKLPTYFDNGKLNQFLDDIYFNDKKYKGWLYALKYDTSIYDNINSFNIPSSRINYVQSALRVLLIYDEDNLSKILLPNYTIKEKHYIRAIIYSIKEKSFNMYNDNHKRYDVRICKIFGLDFLSGYEDENNKAKFFNIDKFDEEKLKFYLLDNPTISMNNVPKRSLTGLSRQSYEQRIINITSEELDILANDMTKNNLTQQNVAYFANTLIEYYSSRGISRNLLSGTQRYIKMLYKLNIDLPYYAPQYENIDLKDIQQGKLKYFVILLTTKDRFTTLYISEYKVITILSLKDNILNVSISKFKNEFDDEIHVIIDIQLYLDFDSTLKIRGKDFETYLTSYLSRNVYTRDIENLFDQINDGNYILIIDRLRSHP